MLDTSAFTGSGKGVTDLTMETTSGAEDGTQFAKGKSIRIQLPTSLVVRASCGFDDHHSIMKPSEHSIE